MEYTRPFSYGTKGDDVRAFQTNLLKLGYDLPKYGADGSYGKETEGAAKDCCTDNHWDFCSWGQSGGEPPLPVWLQERVEETAGETPEPSVWIPKGRGMFIQSMNVLDAAEAETITKAVGLKFVIVQAHWQYLNKGSNRYNWPDDLGLGLAKSYGCTANAQEVVEKFRALDVAVIPFSYPVPGKHMEVIDALSAYQEAWGSPSVIIDPEEEWKSEEGAYKSFALDLSAMMTKNFPSWGMTSFGAPWFHRSFPYAEFSSAPYGLPQTYGVTTFGTVEGYNRAHYEWETYGFKQLVHLYGTYDKTDAQMRQLLNVVASFKPASTAGWKWGSTSDPEWDHINNILPE